MSDFMNKAWLDVVAKRRLEVRKENGKFNDDPRSAVGTDLDACAAGWDIYRKAGYESDFDFRNRLLEVIEKRTRRL
jgi:hypothetical protein